MNIETLAYLALKQIVKTETRRGDVLDILKGQGFEISATDARDIAEYIKSQGYGTITYYPKGHTVIDANIYAVDFINKLKNMTFEQKLKLVYSELENLPDRKGNLETLLSRLGIEQNSHITSEFISNFRETGHVNIVAESKDGYDIVLTQKGQDYLHSPAERSIQPNIFFENYQNSIVNKGNGISQSGVFDSGINNDTTYNPITNPTPNPNSPTKKIQRWQLLIAIIVGIFGFITFCITLYKLFQ